MSDKNHLYIRGRSKCLTILTKTLTSVRTDFDLVHRRRPRSHLRYQRSGQRSPVRRYRGQTMGPLTLTKDLLSTRPDFGPVPRRKPGRKFRRLPSEQWSSYLFTPTVVGIHPRTTKGPVRRDVDVVLFYPDLGRVS